MSKKVRFAHDVEGNNYVYWNGWTPVEFEADLEIFQDDMFYNEIDEIYYKYQNDKKEIISKNAHLFFVKGEFGKIDSSVIYLKKDGSLDYHSSLPGFLGNMPEKVEFYYGEVFITMKNEKRYIFYHNDWVESIKWNMGYGPFFFKTTINEYDPTWNKIHTDIITVENGKKTEKRRPVYFKILKDDPTLVYYSENGKEWYKHSELPSQFESLTSTAYLRYAKTFETVVHTGGGDHLQLTQNPMGFFKKGYRNVWKSYDKRNLLEEYSGDFIIAETYLQIYDLGDD